MFQTKKKKMQAYLDAKPLSKYTLFDQFLSDYLSGTLKEPFVQHGLKHVYFTVDWDDDFHCINVFGKYWDYYIAVEISADPDQYCISRDLEDPDCAGYGDDYPLESKEQLFEALDLEFRKIDDLE